MAPKKKPILHTPNTGAEEIPPGATRQAFDREEMPGGGPPGSGGGDRHGAGEPGGGFLFDGIVDNPEVDPTIPPDEEETEAFGGATGGAVGGTPANKRSEGGEFHGGFNPGASHRGDSTVGADPDSDA